MRALIVVVAGALAASGLALAGAAPAYARCQGGFTPWGGQEICDSPLASDGSFERCITTNAMGFGGSNCFTLNINTMTDPTPYLG